MNTPQNGKGDKLRPCNYSKFRSNYDKIKWNKEKSEKSQKIIDLLKK